MSETLSNKGIVSQLCKKCTVSNVEEPVYLTDTIEEPQECLDGNSKHPDYNAEGKQHVCTGCGKRFTRFWALKKHCCLQDKEYVCEVCGKQFTQSRNLLVHSRSHTGEKPFICNICNRGFSYSGDLKTHTRIHTGEKPHVCDVCKKAFSKQGKLKIHYRIHTGEKIGRAHV
jgi:KRAB domain-containing zinc finger protein